MAHSHHHGHDHLNASENERLLGRAFVLIATFLVVEVVGGLLANSLTLHASVEEPGDLSLVMQRIKALLNDDFGIHHSTVQVDHGGCPDHR